MKKLDKKKLIILGIILACVIAAIVIIAVAGRKGSQTEESEKPELTLKMNIEGAGILSGAGKFEYNDDLQINAQTNSGYYFLGWYYNNDLLSTSAEYSCKMWDKDVTLEAKFIALPNNYNEEFGDMSPDELTNRSFVLSVITGMPNYGKISVNDEDSKDKYSSSEKSGTNVKAIAITTSSRDFLGWFDEANNLIMSNNVFSFAMPSFDYTLTAKWECSCTYNYNAEEGIYVCESCGNSCVASELADENGFVILKNSYFVFGDESVSIKSENVLVEYIGDDSVVIIPDTVNRIGASVFSKNTSLTSVTIPASVTNIDSSAFNECSSLEKIYFNATAMLDFSSDSHIFYRAGYSSEGIKLIIGANVTKIPAYLFHASFPNITSIEFEEGSVCKSIGKYAFNNCRTLTNVTIPESVETIGDSAFAGCYYLTDITLPFVGNTKNGTNKTHFGFIFGVSSNEQGEKIAVQNVTITGGDINEYAFYECKYLKSVTICDDVNLIGKGAFYGCTNLESITLPFLAEKKYGKSTCLGYIFGTSDYEYNDSYVPTSLKTVIITGGFEIDECAFFECSSLTNVAISVQVINEEAFYGCTNLESITIDDNITTIHKYAFSQCSKLTSIKYCGTEEQWNAIRKYSLWDSFTGSYRVIYNYTEE